MPMGSHKRVAGVFAVLAIAILAWAIVAPEFRLVKLMVVAFAASVSITALARNKVLAGVALSVASIALTLTIIDGATRLFVTLAPASSLIRTYANDYTSFHPAMGAVPTPSLASPSSRVTTSGEVIYDVTYTFDEHGHRKTPGGRPASPTYLFFGGSFAFGEGVEDDETFEARFSEAAGFRNAVVNFAWHGWGPHHMLRKIEQSLVRDAVSGSVETAFYLFIPDHINRVGGIHKWTHATPRYRLESDGTAKAAGLFGDDWLQAKRDGLTGLVAQGVYRNMVMSVEKRQALTVAVVKQAERLLAEEFGAKFVLLHWDSDIHWELANGDKAEFERLLGTAGIDVVNVSGLLGDLESPANKIHSLDEHPSPQAHQKLGQALAELYAADR